MKKLKSSLINCIIEKPFATLLAAFAFFLLSLPGLSLIESNFSYRVWFKDSDPLIKTLDKFDQNYGSSESLVLVVSNPKGIFNKKTLDYIELLTQESIYIEATAKVESLTNYSWIEAKDDEIIIDSLYTPEKTIAEIESQAMSSKEIVSHFVGKNKKVSLIFLKLKADVGKKLLYKDILNQVEEMLSRFSPPEGIDIRLAGNAVVSSAFKDSSIKDFKILFPLLFVLICFFLYLNFKSFKVIFLSFTTIIVSVISMFAFMGFINIPIHNLTAITPEFLLAIGLADAIHIIATFYLFRHSDDCSHTEALRRSLDKNFLPTILTTLTTSIGFLSFSTSSIQNIGQMGVVAAIGTFMAWFYTYFLLAPCLNLFLKNKPIQSKVMSHLNYRKWVDFIFKFEKPIYIVFISLLLVSAYLISKLEVNSDPLKYFNEDFPIAKDLNYIEKNVGGVFSLEMSVDSGKQSGTKNPIFLKKVESFSQEIAEKFSVITQVVSLVDIVKRMNEVFHNSDRKYKRIPQTQQEVAQYLFTYNLSVPEGSSLNDRVTLDQRHMRVTALVKNQDSKGAVMMAKEIQSIAQKYNLNLTITGKRYLWQSINGKVVTSFVTSLGVALFFISLILLFFLRSFKAGLISLIPNLVPVLSVGIILQLVGRPLDIGAVVIASVVLGIAVDDTIHIFTNYLKLIRNGDSTQEAIVKLFQKSAPALIVTTLILSISFSCFLLASFVPNQNLGLLMACGLVIALITDFLLLPLLLAKFIRE
ncbi:MAG: MMPL family transporter [Bacteriovoracaceae bacterium]|jgi:predicted RND superfamily exporter protein|nr:hypothetical protein [Halobacteriovoraceae bacterium]MDP7319461.1 MMPL family transporter [Bacteriovoracaceae bacterium]